MFGLTRPLVVTDGFLVSSGMVDRIVAPLTKAGITARVFPETVPDPTAASVEAALAGNALATAALPRSISPALLTFRRMAKSVM